MQPNEEEERWVDDESLLILYGATPQNGQAHSNNSAAVADELFECVWPFCGVGALRVKNKRKL